MRIDRVYIKRFKNLIDFHIDFDQSQMQTVLLGKNASGKSNFLEALVIIFRDLDLDNSPQIEYSIRYQCKENIIEVTSEADKGAKVHFSVNGTIVSKKFFYEGKENHLPKYVFAYYSGVSNRLIEHFDQHQRKFYYDLLDGVNEPLRTLFYAQLIHSHFVLMAFYSFEEDDSKAFLKDYLSIVGLESILFVLKEPYWYNKARKVKDGDPRFWNARGTVRDFLREVYKVSIAPIKTDGRFRKDFINNNAPLEQLYLFVSNENKLKQLASLYGDNVNFFKMLESTYMNDLIHEIRIRVKKVNSDGTVTFKELSEGEQQLLTVLGLLRFTKADESLILLDEPDTHLNPLWKWQYMSLLEKIVKRPKSSQILMTTHDPLVIGGLTKEQIRIFNALSENGRIEITVPDIDPKGLGVAGILTSELFGLPTVLDEDTQLKLEEKRKLQILFKEGKLNKKDKTRLIQLENELEKYGFSKYQRDPLYQKFIEATLQIPELQRAPSTEEEKEEQDKKMVGILDEILKKEKGNTEQ